MDKATTSASSSIAAFTLFPRVRNLLVEQGVGDILLTGGGIMNEAEMQQLAAMGVGRLFGPGTHMDVAIDYIRNEVQERRAGRDA